tara:strand:- start:2256 stop:2417 length:162 start_codon:yes stop_codon:yes gene_type:complete
VVAKADQALKEVARAESRQDVEDAQEEEQCQEDARENLDLKAESHQEAEEQVL